ncbi:MAG: protein translocase subunit SecD [Dehalococcoidales bacterium]|nr:protein translocase subunit SecD [Dehalococcoidales bacterium]
MLRRNSWVLITVIVVFALALWVLLPIEGERLGRQGIQFGLDLKGGVRLVYQADLSGVTPGTEDEIMDGVLAVIANRINPLGVTEPDFHRRGDDQIVVELPGTDITDIQKERIGRTALLGFRERVEVPIGGEEVEVEVGTEEEGEEPVDGGEEEQAEEGEGEVEEPVDEGEEEESEPVTIWMWVPATGTVNGEEKALNSSYFKENTYIDRGQFGEIELHFEWNEEGIELSEQITGRLVVGNQPLGIFEGDQPLLGDDGQPIAPRVQAVITDRGIITGLSMTEATELSKQLNAGRLPVPLTRVGEMTVKPKLGEDFVDLSVRAGLIGIALVMLFMITYYRIPGLMASLALVFYGVIVLALFKLLGVTLTLAGIGGFVLSIGMAVDANVLIFERMKEEFRMGRALGAATEAGFNRAWTAIRDSNITTMIVCGILIWVGGSIAFGGSVQGFGVTLLIGVTVSMITAIVVTRTFLRLFIGTNLAKQTRLFTIYSGKKDV